MVHWYWLLVALFGGSCAGVFVTCLCTVAKWADENNNIN